MAKLPAKGDIFQKAFISRAQKRRMTSIVWMTKIFSRTDFQSDITQKIRLKQCVISHASVEKTTK
jgi:hypothetical protein